MSLKFTGRCSCGRASFTIRLPETARALMPRACDCEFCADRGIEYLSHPSGDLQVHSTERLRALRHGSKQAQFLACRHCRTVVAVVCEFNTGLKGAANATLLDERDHLRPPERVSPRLLAPPQRPERWAKLWSPATIKAPSQ